MKRIISTLIVFAFVLCLIPAGVFAKDDDSPFEMCTDLYCTTEKCTDVFEVTSDCTLRSGPGQKYTERSKIDRGDFVRVISYKVNKNGDMWASTDWDGEETFIYANNIKPHTHNYHVVKDDNNGYFAYCECGNCKIRNGPVQQTEALAGQWVGNDLIATALAIKTAASAVGVAAASMTKAIVAGFVIGAECAVFLLVVGGVIFALYVTTAAFARVEKVETIDFDQYRKTMRENGGEDDGYLPCAAVKGSSCSLVLMPFSMSQDEAAKYLIAVTGVDQMVKGINTSSLQGYKGRLSNQMLLGVYTPGQANAVSLCKRIESLTSGIVSYGSSQWADQMFECNYSDRCSNHYHLHVGVTDYFLQTYNRSNPWSNKVSGIHVFFGGNSCITGRYF